MMENSDFLFVTAEIGVAFTGFAGLVTVLARRGENFDKHRIDVSRIRMVLIGSIITVLLSLLPFVVARFVEGAGSMSTSALISALAIGYLAGFEIVVPVLKFRRNGTVANLNWTILILNVFVLSASSLALLICVLIYPNLIEDVYIAAIYAVIFAIGNTLVRFFISLAGSES
jgi:hypothetical protein